MQNKLPKKEYIMAAVIGLNSKNIEDVCKELRKQNKFVVPSNYNYQNQTVISGEKEAVEEACEILKNKGAKKVVLLKTSGPFHTSELEEAKELYNPVATRDLLKFDYVALGHIHKPKYDNRIVYPGSPISFGFDELGAHGFISGEIKNREINIEFIPIDEREFKEINYDISAINSKEELIEKLQELKLNKKDFYKIILNGKRNFEINILEINKLIQNNNILKLKDKTKINYELDKIKNENSLRGIYVDLILEKIKELNNEEEINKYLRAIEIGLDSLENT